jgi:aryl-alcohol dehydrogenase-like predicted oxidoreductase
MGDDPNQRGGSRRWIITEVENSLRRLGTDWIDLYQVHRPDSGTDVEETLSALTDLVQQGKVRYIGSSSSSSSSSASEIVEAQWTAHARNLQRFRTEQPPYSILVRGIELDVLPTAQRHGTASSPTARSPAAGFQGAGAPTVNQPPPRGSGWPRALTCRCRRTNASSKPSSISRKSPTRPGCR